MKNHLLGLALLAVMGTGFSAPALSGGVVNEHRTLGEPTETVDSAPALFNSASKFQRQVQLANPGSSVSYVHQLQLPAGVRLLAGAGEEQALDLYEDIQVIDAKGQTLGYIDSAWAQDSLGTSLPSAYRIQGNTLVQLVDATKAMGAVTALLQYTGLRAETNSAGENFTKAYVGVPSNYVYNLNHPRRTLHDYCTKSPDEFPNPVGANANFRGPCARHDLCFEQRQASQYTCNNRLWGNLVSNCEYTYAWYNPVRQTCINTAHVYWIAVTANTIW